MATIPTSSYVGTNANEIFNISSVISVVVDAAAGDDVVWAFDGYDLLYGGPGADLVFGSGASDTIYGDWYADPSKPGGSDFILGDSNLQGAPPAFQGLDLIFAGAGDDLVNGEGNNDHIDGGTGEDNLWGGFGADFIAGGDGNDNLWGGSSANKTNFIVVVTLDGPSGNPASGSISSTGGIRAASDASNDILIGGDGDDSLYGQRGNDRLTGGEGNDSFIFDTPLDAGTNVDDVRDFVPGKGKFDDLILSQAIFTAIGETLSKGEFRFGSKAKDGSDLIIYNKNSGALSYDGDGKDGNAAVLFATLDEKLNLSHKDFTMIA